MSDCISRERAVEQGASPARRWVAAMRVWFTSAASAVIVALVLAACHPATQEKAEPWPEVTKIRFSLEGIRPDGLRGSPDGLVSVAYEFCAPADEKVYAEVRRIDPGVQISPGMRGRIGCAKDQALCSSSTHQPHWREALKALSQKSYIGEIRECFFE